MIENGYIVSTVYIFLGVAGFTLSDGLDMSAKAMGVLLAIAGFFHLLLKIHGQYLDNKIKQETLEE